MKTENSPIQSTTAPQIHSAVRGGGASLAFDRATGMMKAKADHPPLKSPHSGLSQILLPQARNRWMLPMAAQMTPQRIEQILRSALTSESPRAEQELYSLMESTWPRYLKNRMEVADAVLGLDWNIMETEETMTGAKELIERTKNGMRGDPCCDGHGWRATLGTLLDAWFRGVSISEIEWEYRSSGSRMPAAWLPKQTTDIPPTHFGWKHDSGKLMLYPAGEPEGAIEFPPMKFLLGIRKAGKGHPSGTALLRSLAWWWCAANFSSEWLLNFAQIFGQPFRWATYDPAQDGVREELATMMAEMSNTSWGIGPDGSKIEWHEAAKGGADNPQNHMLTLADTACDLLILGQTLTSTQGDRGSQSLGTVHQSVRGDIIDSAALWLAEILNEQLIPAVITANYGEVAEDAALPWFQPARKERKDTKVIAETVEIILRSGIPLLKEEIYDSLDFSQPIEGDEVFNAPATPAPPAGGLAATASPEIRSLLAKLPLDAREYVISKLRED